MILNISAPAKNKNKSGVMLWPPPRWTNGTVLPTIPDISETKNKCGVMASGAEDSSLPLILMNEITVANISEIFDRLNESDVTGVSNDMVRT